MGRTNLAVMKAPTVSRTCSWCHDFNQVATDGSATYCSGCGHRADLPRIFCDCDGCVAMRSQAVALALTDQDREQMTDWAAEQLAHLVRGLMKLPTRVLVMVGNAVTEVSFEEWRAAFGKQVLHDVRAQGHLAALDALGIDVEVVLRRAFDAAQKQVKQ